ncbi:NAD(+)/NADH kinase [Atopobium deltae]|nr:NAD(+)/NADH kinase [Atopobium deltae]
MKVLIVPNYARSAAVQAATELTSWLENEAIGVIWAHDKKKFLHATTSAESCDLVVSLGGDGTLLRAANIIGYAEVPLLGLSFGHVGFLTAADSNNIVKTLASALAGEMHVSRRMTLAIELQTLDTTTDAPETTQYFALNELSLTRGPEGDIIAFSIDVSGNHIDTLRGDGVVVATATGSTGYSLSAGGPIVHPDFRGMIVTPIAAHTISARTFLTSPSDVVEITPSQDRPAARSAFVDGQLVSKDKLVEKVCVRRGKGDIILLDGGPSSFYRSVSRVFYGRAAQQ